MLGTKLGGFFRLVGRAAFRAFKYKPQALQIVAPWGLLLQRGVRVVPQLLQRVLAMKFTTWQHCIATTEAYLQTCPPCSCAFAANSLLVLGALDVLLGLPAVDERSSSLPTFSLSLAFKAAYSSACVGLWPSLSVGDGAELMGPDGVVSRFFTDIGREGKAVLAVPDSR